VGESYSARSGRAHHYRTCIHKVASEPGALPGISVADPDTDQLTITLTDTSGLLEASGAGVSGTDTTSLSISGSIAEVNAALATLTFSGPSDTIFLDATDDLGDSDQDAVSIDANAPIVIAAPESVNIDDSGTTPVTGVSVSDADADTVPEFISVVVSDAQGLLLATGSAIEGSGTTSLIITGSLSEVNAALATLTYDGESDDIITVSADDGRGSTDTADISVGGNAPVTVSAPQSVTLTEAAETPIGGVSVADADADTVPETITVVVTDASGLLLATGSVVAGSGATSLTITGTLSEVNAALATLTYAGSGTDTIDITADDGRGSTDTAEVVVAPSELFTVNDDTVNFNALTDQQLAAVKAGADIYNALGGDDTVTLPSDPAAAALVGYTPGTEFNGGDGNDTIIGGSGNDVINGGPGSDVIIGGGGSDILSAESPSAESGAEVNLVDGRSVNGIVATQPGDVLGTIASLGAGGIFTDPLGATISATAKFFGARSAYTITAMTSGYLKVVKTASGETTYVADVESLNFSDQTTPAMAHPLDAPGFKPRIPLTADQSKTLGIMLRPAPVGSLSRWSADPDGVTRLTYSVAQSADSLPYDISHEDDFKGIVTSPSADQAFGTTLMEWQAYANIALTPVVEVPTGTAGSAIGDIRLDGLISGKTPSGATILARTLPPAATIGALSGNILLSQLAVTQASFQPGELGYWLELHEEGHALGITGDIENASTLSLKSDMYSDEAVEDQRLGLGGVIPSTLLPDDILAIQALYGVRPANTGNDVYSLIGTGSGGAHTLRNSPDAPVVMTIYDTGGHNTLDFSASEILFANIDLTSGNASKTFELDANLKPFARDQIFTSYNTVIQDAIGSLGDDTILGNNSDNVLTGGGGNDVIDGGGSDDPSVDTATYIGARSEYKIAKTPTGLIVKDLTSGRDGTDTLSNIEQLRFGIGNAQTLVPVAGIQTDASVTPNATGGVDITTSEAAVVAADFGTSGVDTVFYSGTADVTLPDDIENITVLGTANVAVTGNALANVIVGNSGANVLFAGAGNDTVIGGAGNDTLIAGHGEGDDSYDGGDGRDLIVYASSTLGVTVDLAAGTGFGVEVGHDTIVNVEDVTGGSGADILSGDAGNNAISGGAGNDVLTGRGGNDVIDGGAGIDTAVYSGRHDDYDLTAYGDRAVVQSQDGAADGTDVLTGIETIRFADRTEALASVLHGDDATVPGANLVGTSAAVPVIGTNGDDTISAGLATALFGGKGNDVLFAGGTGDLLNGGAGNDVLIAGAGSDTLVGGGGDNLFVFHPGDVAGDIISDFHSGGGSGGSGDLIQFDGFGPDATLVPRNASAGLWTINYAGTSEAFTVTGDAALRPSNYFMT
jgi:Ca2+-binding RTX toxin-like protein